MSSQEQGRVYTGPVSQWEIDPMRHAGDEQVRRNMARVVLGYAGEVESITASRPQPIRPTHLGVFSSSEPIVQAKEVDHPLVGEFHD